MASMGRTGGSARLLMGGKLVEICAKQGSKVRKGDVIAYIQREE